MDRRTFIKGAVIAASTPAAAFAPALVTTLDALISEHAAVTDQAGELAERIDALSSDPTQPAPAAVSVVEVDPENRAARLTGDKRMFVVEVAIEAYFADLKQGVEHLRAQGLCNHLYAEHRLAQMPCQIIAAKALLREREATMEAWETACGITALQTESDRLWQIGNDLEDRIIGWPCTTLDEARAKATFAQRQYAGEMSKSVASILSSMLA